MLTIKYRNTNDLIPYVNNSRIHSEVQVTQIASSIKEFGFTTPVLVDESSGIIAGHGRLLAAQKLGLDKVPTIVLKDLTEAQRKAYVIADNKLALNASWDMDLLELEIEKISSLGFDLELLGFEDFELNFAEIDYSALDGENIDDVLDGMADGVKKAIQIEFDAEHYEEAVELVKYWRDEGAYIGAMLIEMLRSGKEKV